MRSISEMIDNPEEKDFEFFANLMKEFKQTDAYYLQTITLKGAIENELNNPDPKFSEGERLGYVRGMNQALALIDGHINVAAMIKAQKKARKLQSIKHDSLSSPADGERDNTAGLI